MSFTNVTRRFMFWGLQNFSGSSKFLISKVGGHKLQTKRCSHIPSPPPSNRHVVLTSRPGASGEPEERNFGLEDCPMPLLSECPPYHVVVKNLYLSMDPALRCRMNEDSGVDYMSAWQLRKPIDGLGGVGVVEASSDPDLSIGDLVTATFPWPWASYFATVGAVMKKLPKELFANQPSLALSLLGVTGLTAYLGLAEKGHVTPGAGQTVVISAAAGATGSLAGQIARLLGAGRVVGLCGSDAKCAVLKDSLGFDAAINYKQGDLADRLAAACPDGVHLYFDNVGGDLSETVVEQMVPDSHVILCGQIAVYNQDVPYPPPISPRMGQVIAQKRITRERFLVLQYADRFDQALATLFQWYLDGKVKTLETIEEGLENTGKAFVSMMKGGNIGKQLVRVHQH